MWPCIIVIVVCITIVVLAVLRPGGIRAFLQASWLTFGVEIDPKPHDAPKRRAKGGVGPPPAAGVIGGGCRAHGGDGARSRSRSSGASKSRSCTVVSGSVGK